MPVKETATQKYEESVRLFRDGNVEDAVAHLSGAIELLEAFTKEHPEDTEAKLQLARCFEQFVRIFRAGNKQQEAEAVAEAAASIYRELAEGDPEPFGGDYAEICYAVGNLFHGSSFEKADHFYSEALKWFAVCMETDYLKYASHAADCHNNYAVLLYYNGEPLTAEREYLQAVAICEELFRRSEPESRENLMMAYQNLSSLYFSQGRFEEGMELFKKMRELE